MELYLPPTYIKNGSRFKKGHTPWNKGRKGFTTSNPEKREKLLKNIEEGRKNLWAKRDRTIVYNQKPVTAYDLQGNFVGAYKSIGIAARELGVSRKHIQGCLKGERGRAGSYQFRPAEVVEFQGQRLVSRKPIAPYKRRTRWSKRRKDDLQGGI